MIRKGGNYNKENGGDHKEEGGENNTEKGGNDKQKEERRHDEQSHLQLCSFHFILFFHVPRHNPKGGVLPWE